MDYEQEFIRKMKTAGLKDLIVNHPSVASGAAGGALFLGGQYLMNRRRKDGTSFEQQHQQKALQSREAAAEKKPTFANRYFAAHAKGERAIADVVADHPVKGALLVVPEGIGVGIAGYHGVKHLLKLMGK